MAKTGFKSLKEVEEPKKGEEREGIAYKYRNERPYVTPTKQYKAFSDGLRPRTPLGDLTTLPQTP